MSEFISRRSVLCLAPVLPLVTLPGMERVTRTADAPPNFPAHEPAVVKEVVTVAHFDLARTKELVTARPALARVSWDWGFGDWETPIDAASHVGNRAIAGFLIANGARPTIYTAAMMGQLPIVKQWIDAVPGVQHHPGPHGITLLAHARNGGAAAAEVYEYLKSLGDADPRYTDLPVTDDDVAAIVGEYVFGSGTTERFVVARNARGGLTIQRTGAIERGLSHQGGLAFIPAGAEAVRIRFELDGSRAAALVVEDGVLTVRAVRR